MSKGHQTNFRAKHPPNTTIDPVLKESVTHAMPGGRITCKQAFSIAADLSLDPIMVGTAIDFQEGRITACQLDLFGYGEKRSPISGADTAAEELLADIHACLIQGRLQCKAAWRIARKHNLPKLKIGQACESLGIRISQCQLGAF